MQAIYDVMTGHTLDVLRVALWLVAGAIAFSFSIGSARIWTSIAVGFFLVFLSQGYLVAPWVMDTRLAALHSVIGTIAVLVMTHGFQEYYVFSRTLEAGGSKWPIYLGTLGVIVASALFVLINPTPGEEVLRNIRMIENACWVFLSLINIDMIRKIYAQVRGSPIASGFVAFGVAFALIFLWRGSVLYLQVYGWDGDGQALAAALEGTFLPERVAIAHSFHAVAGILASVSVGTTFTYVYRLLR